MYMELIDDDNGVRLFTDGMVITGTIFPHYDVHKTLRTTENQIDHVLI